MHSNKDAPNDIEALPPWPRYATIRVYHHAHATFYSPSDMSGWEGMHSEIIQCTPCWHKECAHYNTVLLKLNDVSSIASMVVTRVRLFFTLHLWDNQNTVYLCTLVDHYKILGRQPDHVMSMWKVSLDKVNNNQVLQSVEPLDSIVCAVHLLPVFGTGYIPDHWPYSLTLDSFQQFYINKYADHHSHQIIY